MAFKFKDVLNLCEKRGFLQFKPNSSVNNSISMSLGPVGHLLRENIKNEWLFSNVINRDVNVFLTNCTANNTNIDDTFDYVKHLNDDKLPFGIAQITNEPDVMNITDDDYFQASNQIKLETFMFVPPGLSVQYFHNWQRQRRMWWRKFSASPGRYTLTDIQIPDSGHGQSVEIMSHYPWASHIIERIHLYCNEVPFLTNEQLQAKDGRKRVQSDCILSTTYLNTIVLNTLCDVFDTNMLRFHRKIAPYKLSFAIASSSSTDELNELAIYLGRKLRANNISVLLLPSNGRVSLETQWNQFDELGIPYCVVLNDGTLKNGIASLRNRDTTLKEQIHISDLLGYVEKLFKCY